VNTLHAAGFNASGTAGNAFFTGSSAATIGVNSVITANPALVQSSGSSTATGDTSIALAIGQMADTAQAALGGRTFSQAYSKIVGDLGSSLKTANDNVDNETALAKSLASQRASVSGVSLDEEMTNLMSFQQAYTASAQLVKTIDEMLQTTLSIKR
jgi:flagellar hook-associated protein 1 FlgK